MRLAEDSARHMHPTTGLDKGGGDYQKSMAEGTGMVARAYGELARAYKQLQELDLLKSKFMETVSQELRSRAANVNSRLLSGSGTFRAAPSQSIAIDSQSHVFVESELPLVPTVAAGCSRETGFLS